MHGTHCIHSYITYTSCATRLHCRCIPYLCMLYMLRTPYIVTSHCTSRHISLHTKSHRTAHRTAYIDSHCTDRHIALHTQSHRAAHTVTPHCIHRHLSAYILTSLHTQLHCIHIMSDSTLDCIAVTYHICICYICM